MEDSPGPILVRTIQLHLHLCPLIRRRSRSMHSLGRGRGLGRARGHVRRPLLATAARMGQVDCTTHWNLDRVPAPLMSTGADTRAEARPIREARTKANSEDPMGHWRTRVTRVRSSSTITCLELATYPWAPPCSTACLGSAWASRVLFGCMTVWYHQHRGGCLRR